MSSSTWALVGEIDRLTNLTAEQAARIEALEAECFRLAADTCHAGYGDDYGHHRCREVDEANTRADAAERALAFERVNIHARFGKWSKALDWGLTGFQPECWALMDAAVEELVSKRGALAEAVEVMRPFAALSQRYADTVSDGWIPWTEFITDHEWPSELDCQAVRAFVQQHEGKK